MTNTQARSTGAPRSEDRRWPYRPGDLAAIAAAVLCVIGLTLVTHGIAAQESPPQPPDWAAHSTRHQSPLTSPGRTAHHHGRLPPWARLGLPRSPPIRIDIPAIGVHTSLMELGLNPDHTLQVPPLDVDEAGWYKYSPTPGQIGPSIILGHVDSATGPSVFFELGALRRGDRVSVTRADGVIVDFRVGRVASYPKSRFPTLDVYGNTNDPQLRLITCGGRYDSVRRTHVDNIVVYAESAVYDFPTLASAPPAGSPPRECKCVIL